MYGRKGCRFDTVVALDTVEAVKRTKQPFFNALTDNPSLATLAVSVSLRR